MVRPESIPVSVIEVKESLLSANVWQSGHYLFADGGHGLVKLEMDNLWHFPAQLEKVLWALANNNQLPPADIIIGVPTGGQRLAAALIERGMVDLPMVWLDRQPGGAKQDFQFRTKQDQLLAQAADRVRIYEDVVSTLSSVAGVVKLLNPHQQSIHSLAIWRRGMVKDHYRFGVTDHYLVEELLPIYDARSCPVCAQR